MPQSKKSDKHQATATADSTDMASWKPGSEPAKHTDAKDTGDFGVPEGAGPSRARDYVSENTKRSDPGGASPRSGEEEDGVRTSGAGANNSGPGSSSGGDVDTDVLGIGDGIGISESGPGDPAGADDVGGSERPGDPFAARKPSAQEASRQSAGRKKNSPDDATGQRETQSTDDSQGADSANNPLGHEDDSFAGEISSGEARGDDEPISGNGT